MIDNINNKTYQRVNVKLSKIAFNKQVQQAQQAQQLQPQVYVPLSYTYKNVPALELISTYESPLTTQYLARYEPILNKSKELKGIFDSDDTLENKLQRLREQSAIYGPIKKKLTGLNKSKKIDDREEEYRKQIYQLLDEQRLDYIKELEEEQRKEKLRIRQQKELEKRQQEEAQQGVAIPQEQPDGGVEEEKIGEFPLTPEEEQAQFEEELQAKQYRIQQLNALIRDIENRLLEDELDPKLTEQQKLLMGQRLEEHKAELKRLQPIGKGRKKVNKQRKTSRQTLKQKHNKRYGGLIKLLKKRMNK